MEIYISKRDETVKAVLESVNEKFGTVELKYITGPKKDSIAPITKSTLKRWWYKREVEQAEEKEKPVVKPVEKQKTTPKKKPVSDVKKRDDKTVENILKVVQKKYDVKFYDSINAYIVKSNGKSIAEIRPQKKCLMLYVKSMDNVAKEYLKREDIICQDGYKYFLPVHIKIAYNDDYLEVMQNIIGG